ncbi:MAG TPA: hypothetical protein VL202_19275 [Pararhizobium sp.]|uniref:hypothetical protein n=1 Tax=Pararhizobium sp. TaxID=1977563 RepID=UPI002B6B9C7D|nr:hypothetical protein [Pararhizobium sp.]HTO33293.1 hypothetical protein [Pararhizobium sp.]
MSNIVEYMPSAQDVAITLLLQGDNGDKLTDILVDALDEAFRILQEEITSYPLN